MSQNELLRAPRYRSPLYTEAEAAQIVGVSASTLRNWTRGYGYKRIDGQHQYDALVTTAPAFGGRTIPFVGLVEAYVLAAFRRTGVPMQRIRPAVAELEHRFGLVAALASERLKSDGAEVLYEAGLDPNLDAGFTADSRRLVVARNGQHLFAEVVEDHLETIHYEEGLARWLRLPGWSSVEVVADPDINGGQPTVKAPGIRVADIRDRSAAGESAEEIAQDFRLELEDVRTLIAA